jgi:hypothetical protein
VKTTRRCRIEGATYEIPDIWLAGWIRRHPRDPLEAVGAAIRYWHNQALLEQEWEESHK